MALICLSQAQTHLYPGMGYPGFMGMGNPGFMGMGYPGMMGMPYGMYKETDDASSSTTPRAGAIEEVYQPQGAEVHDPQIPQPHSREDKIPELVR